MRNLIKTIFRKTAGAQRAAAGEKVVTETELQVATCAVLLEIAHADETFSAAEERRIVDLMQQRFRLSEEAVYEIKAVSDAERQDSIDLWQFTSTLKEHYTPDQRREVIEMIWGVIYADGTLDKYEDYLAHKLAKLLGLNHRELIDAKVRVLRSAGT